MVDKISMTDTDLRAALKEANLIIKMFRDHCRKDHPDCAYAGLGVMQDEARRALAAPAADDVERLIAAANYVVDTWADDDAHAHNDAVERLHAAIRDIEKEI